MEEEQFSARKKTRTRCSFGAVSPAGPDSANPTAVAVRPPARSTDFVESVGRLQQAFPQLHAGIITAILETHNGDLQLTQDSLRQLVDVGSAAAQQTSSSSSVPPAQSPAFPSRKRRQAEDEDMDTDQPPLPSGSASQAMLPGTPMRASPSAASLAGGAGEAGASASQPGGAGGARQINIAAWVERFISNLKAVSSVEEGAARCSALLSAFAVDVRSLAASPAAAAAAGQGNQAASASGGGAAPGEVSKLQSTNQTLVRAMRVLCVKNQGLQAQAQQNAQQLEATRSQAEAVVQQGEQECARLRREVEEAQASNRQLQSQLQYLQFLVQAGSRSMESDFGFGRRGPDVF